MSEDLKAVDAFAKHEVVHMAHVVSEMFGTYVLEHPVVEEDAELRKTAEDVGAMLFDFYQLVAQRF